MMPALIPIQIVVDGEQILRSAGEGGTLENPNPYLIFRKVVSL